MNVRECAETEGEAKNFKMSHYKGSTGTPMQIWSIKPKKKSKLIELEKLKRGIGCAKGSNLKYYPNEQGSSRREGD